MLKKEKPFQLMSREGWKGKSPGRKQQHINDTLPFNP